jgi:glycosyltransferase involved in cell wall biosynthesis
MKQLVFVGSASHMPNKDGVSWFIENVWPTVKNKFSKLQFKVVGDWKFADSEGLLRSGIEFTGILSEKELETVITESDIGISPLRFGAGMKRKTLNYMAHGLPVVTTNFGIEGVFRGNPQGIELANTESEWVEAITKLDDGLVRSKLGFQGGSFIQKNFSIEKQRGDLENLIKLVALDI